MIRAGDPVAYRSRVRLTEELVRVPLATLLETCGRNGLEHEHEDPEPERSQRSFRSSRSDSLRGPKRASDYESRGELLPRVEINQQIVLIEHLRGRRSAVHERDMPWTSRSCLDAQPQPSRKPSTRYAILRNRQPHCGPGMAQTTTRDPHACARDGADAVSLKSTAMPASQRQAEAPCGRGEGTLGLVQPVRPGCASVSP